MTFWIAATSVGAVWLTLMGCCLVIRHVIRQYRGYAP